MKWIAVKGRLINTSIIGSIVIDRCTQGLLNTTFRDTNSKEIYYAPIDLNCKIPEFMDKSWDNPVYRDMMTDLKKAVYQKLCDDVLLHNSDVIFELKIDSYKQMCEDLIVTHLKIDEDI